MKRFLSAFVFVLILSMGISDSEAKSWFRTSHGAGGAKSWNLGAKQTAKKSLSMRAKQIHSSAKPDTQRRTTIAVTNATHNETGKKVRLVSSSEQALRREQRSALRPGEIEVRGDRAEIKGVEYAKRNNMRPTMTAASRPVCENCQNVLVDNDVSIASPRK